MRRLILTAALIVGLAAPPVSAQVQGDIAAMSVYQILELIERSDPTMEVRTGIDLTKRLLEIAYFD